MRWLVLMLLLIPGASWAAVTASVTVRYQTAADNDDTPADGTNDCPAPCHVQLDATTTTSDEVDAGSEHDTIRCEWDYGDPTGGRNPQTWGESWQSGYGRNVDYGFIGQHVYWPDDEDYSGSPGTVTFNGQVECCEPDGDCDTDTFSVVVVNPFDYYGAANTTCISSSGDFTDCPFTVVEGATHTTSSDFDTSFGTEGVGCNQNGKLCLFKCGETFANSESALKFDDATQDMSMVGSYGGCETNSDLTGFPIIDTENAFAEGEGFGVLGTFDCDSTVARCAGGWNWYGLHIRGDDRDPGGDATTTSEERDYEPPFGFDTGGGASQNPDFEKVGFHNMLHTGFTTCVNDTDNFGKIAELISRSNSKYECDHARFGHELLTNYRYSSMMGVWFLADEDSFCGQPNSRCEDLDYPWDCCTGNGTGTCGTAEPSTQDECGDEPDNWSCDYGDSSATPSCDCWQECENRSGWRSAGMSYFRMSHSLYEDLSDSWNLHQHIREDVMPEGNVWILFSDNRRLIEKTNTPVRLCENTDCGGGASGGSAFQHVVFERVLWTFKHTLTMGSIAKETADSIGEVFGISADDVTIRNSVFELYGSRSQCTAEGIPFNCCTAANTGADCDNDTIELVSPETRGGESPSNLKVYNVTVHVPDTNDATELVLSDTGQDSGETCGNLVYGPDLTSVTLVDVGYSTCVAGDSYDGSADTETVLFDAALPTTPGNARMSDFELGASSSAVDAGYDYTSQTDGYVFLDGLRRCRSGSYDAGAVERGASTCLATASDSPGHGSGGSASITSDLWVPDLEDVCAAY